MRKNPFVEKHKRLTEEDLSEFETQLGVRLPESARLHFLKHNGGRPRRTFFRTSDGREYGVAWFYAIKHRNEDGDTLLEETVELLRAGDRLPPNMIPIAHDDGGADFCVSLTDGSIWFLNSHSDDGIAILVAPTLDAFIAGMLTTREFYAGKTSADR